MMGPGLAVAVALRFVACLSAVAPAQGPEAVERRVVAMGTTLDVAVRLPERASALAAAQQAIEEVARVEALLTTWREGGPLDRVNRARPNAPVAASPELIGLLEQTFAWSHRTGQAFDPTVAPLVRAWDLRGAGRIASSEEIAAARTATGTDHFRLEPESGTVVRLAEASAIDEGAWGKGYALDRAALRLQEAGAADALLDLGGQTLALGNDRGGAWSVLVAHPRRRGQAVVRLALPAGHSLSTSGNSERGLTVAGRRIGHLLDPQTGEPAADFGSVSVLSASGLLADILSTAFFVLGPRDGLALSERLRREGAAHEVLFLIDRGQTLEALCSPGLQPLVLSVDTAVVVGLAKNNSDRRSRP
jgi:thiamine biosynthesis lipoprotein